MMRSSVLLRLGLVATSMLHAAVCVQSESTTTVTTQKLRGRPVIHTRTVHNSQGEHHKETQQQRISENLVDSRSHNGHHTVRMRGAGNAGTIREVDIDLAALDEFTKNHHKEHENHVRGSGNYHHDGNGVDAHISHRDYSIESAHHYDHHEEVEESYHVHHNNRRRHHPESSHGEIHPHGSSVPLIPDTKPTQQRKNMGKKTTVTLPTGVEDHYNQSLFEELHNAPFQIYEAAFGRPLEGRDSFPVFIVPHWKNSRGMHSGFSRTATPFVFENLRFLLKWNDIADSSTGADDDLLHFMHENNFHSNLIIGKTFGENGNNTSFLGLLVTYFQSTQKHILVPFAKLDNFFRDTSEEHLMSESTMDLELEALHEMLDEKPSNDTRLFYQPTSPISDERKQRLKDLEVLHFRRLFQLLIRRSFLFSFGYADCLKTEPHNLRSCLDDTFSIVVRMETTIRGALDEQLVEELAEINEMRHHSKVSEACISVSGEGTMYGVGSCENHSSGMDAFIASPGSAIR